MKDPAGEAVNKIIVTYIYIINILFTREEGKVLTTRKAMMGVISPLLIRLQKVDFTFSYTTYWRSR